MKNKVSTKEKDKKELDPEHAEWLVENRASTQRVSVKLFKLLKEHPTADKGLSISTQALVSISFSLWRAVFLSDKTGFRDDTNEDATKLLSEMLQNNAIAYSQERSSKNWTFNYYASNARYRLEELAEKWPKSEMGLLIPPKPNGANPKVRWEYLQAAFEKAVDYLERLLTKT